MLEAGQVRSRKSLNSAGITSCLLRCWRASRGVRWRWAVPICLVFVLGVGGGAVHAETSSATRGAAEPRPRADHYRPMATSGSLRLLTYNVAGLPSVLSSSNPAVNTPEISPLLNRYDVVLAQEDFSYHAELVERASHRYQKSPRYPRSTMFGDGLTLLSRFPVESDERVRWRTCNGYLLALSDCFAEKGFSAVELYLANHARVVVINVHGDAGSDLGDVVARRTGFAQLARYIDRNFKDQAVIVAGDTNLDDYDVRDRQILERFTKATRLREVCRAFHCQGENLDKVFYRSSAHLRLDPVAWGPDPRFVDEAGEALSDHLAMSAVFRWRIPRVGVARIATH